MIKLTRLSGKPLVVNAEYVKFIEETPDTMITLRDGEKIIVQESAEDVTRKAIDYMREICSARFG